MVSGGSQGLVKVRAVQEVGRQASTQRSRLGALLPVAEIHMSGDPGVEVRVIQPLYFSLYFTVTYSICLWWLNLLLNL